MDPADATDASTPATLAKIATLDKVAKGPTYTKKKVLNVFNKKATKLPGKYIDSTLIVAKRDILAKDLFDYDRTEYLNRTEWLYGYIVPNS